MPGPRLRRRGHWPVGGGITEGVKLAGSTRKGWTNGPATSAASPGAHCSGRGKEESEEEHELMHPFPEDCQI